MISLENIFYFIMMAMISILLCLLIFSMDSSVATITVTLVLISFVFSLYYIFFMNVRDRERDIDNVTPFTSSINENSDFFIQISYNNEETMSSCPICLEDYEIEMILNKLQCNHIYHQECIIEWLKRDKTCPICKHNIL